jgi:hypothetical protein
MTFRRLISLFMFLFFPLAFTSAQGNLLPLGTSGLGASAGAAATKGTTTFGVSAGYSLWGQLDFGVSAGHINRNPSSVSDIPFTYHGSYISPQITWYVARADENTLDASIAFSARYQYAKFSDKPDSPKEDAFVGSASFFEDVLPASSSFKLQPVVSISVVKGEESQTIASAGFFAGIKNVVGRVVGLSAVVGYQLGIVTGGLSVSAVF